MLPQLLLMVVVLLLFFSFRDSNTRPDHLWCCPRRTIDRLLIQCWCCGQFQQEGIKRRHPCARGKVRSRSLASCSQHLSHPSQQPAGSFAVTLIRFKNRNLNAVCALESNLLSYLRWNWLLVKFIYSMPYRYWEGVQLGTPLDSREREPGRGPSS